MTQVFISYSWDGLAHGEWVRALANQLRENGIGVILDTTHVRPGVELPHFMEKSVRDSDFILVICTEKYKLRADARSGGVGYESRLLSAELLAFGDHQKVIPILRGANWRTSAPSYLLGATYIDLRDGPRYEGEYSKLTFALNAENESSQNEHALVQFTRETRPPSLARLRDAEQAELNTIEGRLKSFDAAREIDELRSRIADLEKKFRRDTRDPELKQLLADLSRLDLGFVHWSGVALEEFASIRARPEAVLTIDFSEIYRYMHIGRSMHRADGVALLSFAIAVLRTARQPLYLLPGSLVELRGYLEGQRDEYSDRDSILRWFAKSEVGANAFLLQRHAPLQRLRRLLNEAVIVPWSGTIPEVGKNAIQDVFDALERVRYGEAGPNYVDAINLAMVRELRRDRPAAHITASPKLLSLKDKFAAASDAESPFPLLIHPVQLALVKASNEVDFPSTRVYECNLLTGAPSLLRRWTEGLRHGELPGLEALRDFGEALETSRNLITAFFAWIAREETADLFDAAAQEPAPDQDFDHLYDDIVMTIDRLLTYVDAFR